MYGLEQIKEMNKSKDKLYAVYYNDGFVRAFSDKHRAHDYAELHFAVQENVSVRAFVSV